MMYVLFLVLFFGVRGVGVGIEAKTLSSIVLGFNVWALLTFAYNSVANGLVGEAQTGTLEQLAMSPRGLLGTILTQFWVAFTFITLQITILLILAMATTGHWLHIDVLSILPLVLLTATGLLGIGLAMGGLALIFKRVQSVSAMVQMVLLALVAVQVSQVPIAKLLPVSLGYQLLNDVMVDGATIMDLPLQDLGILLVASAMYFVLGIVVFKRMEGVARDRGLLGQY
jgi:ABC-2 type transport system permease protein